MSNALELMLSLSQSLLPQWAPHSLCRQARLDRSANWHYFQCCFIKRSRQHLQLFSCHDNTAVPGEKRVFGIKDRLLNNHLTLGNYLLIRTKKENWRWVKITKGKRVLLSR